MWGPIPDELGGLSESLLLLALSSNRLTGTLPLSLSSCSRLNFLILANNSLVGSLDPLFPHNYTSFSQLVIFDISNNLFTGSLKSQIFQATNLQFVSASLNCLSGPIPSAVCSASTLQYLILDGINTASSCREPLPELAFISGLRSYRTQTLITGSIPSCLLSLRELRTLHVSNNGFYGLLSNIFPDDSNISSLLSNLALANNFLLFLNDIKT